MDQNFLVREASVEDIMQIYGQMVVENWNPGIFDQLTYAKSKNVRMFVGVLNGTVVSSCCACIYNEAFAFFGCYLVFESKLRGKGYGLAAYKHRLRVMAELGVKAMGCDGVLDQTHNYAKNDFIGYYLNRRFSYTVQGNEIVASNVSIDMPNIKVVADFEAKFVYEPRHEFINVWLNSDPTMRYAVIYNDKNDILGLGIVRQAQTGFRIGPIYANTQINAKNIMLALASQLPKESQLFIDMPEANCHYDHFIKELQLECCDFECMRMYRGEVPSFPVDQIYGVCMLEVG